MKVTLELDEAHARALETLIDRVELELIQRIGTSDQETYDMVFSLECLREALKARHGSPKPGSMVRTAEGWVWKTD